LDGVSWIEDDLGERRLYVRELRKVVPR